MGILHTKPREMHDRVSIGKVILVGICIKQKIRRMQHPHPAAAMRDRRCHVQAVEEYLVGIENAVAIGILVNGDPVVTAVMLRWRWRDLVVGGMELVAADVHNPQARGIRILDELHDPEPAAFVKAQVQRLGHHGFLEHRLGLQSFHEPE